MSKLTLAMAAWAALTATVALGANRPATTQTERISTSEVAATPEMWFYQQEMLRYQDPKVAVRQAAEFRAEQRQRRLESRRWFGLSNMRPQVNGDPLHGDHSPGWVSNDGYHPYRWNACGQSYTTSRQ